MIFDTPLIKKYIHRFLICVCVLMPVGVQADILTFDKVSFIRENNGGAANSYSQLLFIVDYPVIGTKKYLNRNSIMFTFDTDKNLNRVRTDIRFKKDWLKPRKFKSSNNQNNDFYIGSHNLNRNHISDLGTLSQEEKTVLAWMIVNSDELINYALDSKKYIPSGARAYWERVAKGQKFEKNVRKYIGPQVRSKIKEYENFSHSKLILKRTIQPKLKVLKYYSGAIDGIGGPKTTAAIKAFEKENGLLVDGKLFGKERALLVSLAEQKSPSKKKYITKNGTISTVEAQEAMINTYKKRISSLVKENMQLKSKAHSSQKSDAVWDNDLKNTIKGQKNIILSMRKRISSLIKERNSLRDNDNRLISTDPVKYKDIVNTINNQRNIIKTLRARISELSKESSKNNGTLIQSLKNEKMASDQKFFDLNKEQKKLELTAQNQRNIIKTLRSRITQLTSEHNNSGISENNQDLNEQIIKNLRQRISELAKQRNDSKSAEAYKDLENMIQGQKNIIKNLRKRAAVLIKERNKFRDNNDNGVISADPVNNNDLVRTSENQRKIIVSLRQRLTDTQNERNKLRNNAKNKSDGSTGGSNKYLITSLKNELNSLQIRYDVILKQRDKFRKAATQGGAKLSATADNQRNTIETLRKRIISLTNERNTLRSEKYIASNKSTNLKKSEARITQLESELAVQKGSIKGFRNKYAELQRENIKLQVSLDSLAGNSFSDKNQLTNLRDKYQNLYIKNNTLKVDFDKLNRKYKQLTLNVEDKKNKDFENLQRLNEELSMSLQKQKIVAYDAISQKSDIERKLKIVQSEATELNSQMEDFNNIAIVNGALKNDLSQARSQIKSLNNELDLSRNSASAELAKTLAKIAMLEEELEKSKNKFAELEKEKGSTKNGQQRGFVLSSEWDGLKQWITPQQIRFCTILSDYDREKISAQESGNQLKQNLAIDNRDADIDALLLGRNSQEKGYFRNWIGTVEQVFAIYQENEDGDEELAAGVVIKTPCNSVTVGSGRVKSADNERYEGTAFPSDPIYSQLSQVSKGDPILFEGSLLTYQDTGEANRSSKPRFFTNVDSSVNDVEAEKAKKRDKINAPDYFVKIDYLSKL